MAYTLAQSVTEVRYLLNEATASFWSDTEIENWIKQGCLDWCEKTLMLTYDDTVTIVTNQYMYTTSTSSHLADSMRVLHAEHNNKALKRLTYEELRGHNQRVFTSSTPPVYFYDKYDGLTPTLYIAGTPSSTYNGQLITIIVAKQTNDITVIPDEYQPHIFNFAASKAKIKDRQYQEAQLMWQMYLNNIAFARKDKLEIPEQTFDQFKEK